MNAYLNGIMGVVVGDALGVPYEFNSRLNMKKNPCIDMIGHGTYNLEEGCWSDDSSMTIATLDSLRKGYNLEDIMKRFVLWYEERAYLATDHLFDIGITTELSIRKYIQSHDLTSCGLDDVNSNGNGSLMRILPVCIYAVLNHIEDHVAIKMIHEVSSLTHAHKRSQLACGIYYFIVKELINQPSSLSTSLQKGISHAFDYYREEQELTYFKRIQNISELSNLLEENIKSGGYVVDSLEASLWCLLHTDSYQDAVLLAVNLGHDTDTTAAITGGLAGLYYGYDTIPESWLTKIKKRETIEKLCLSIHK